MDGLAAPRVEARPPHVPWPIGTYSSLTSLTSTTRSSRSDQGLNPIPQTRGWLAEPLSNQLGTTTLEHAFAAPKWENITKIEFIIARVTVCSSAKWAIFPIKGLRKYSQNTTSFLPYQKTFMRHDLPLKKPKSLYRVFSIHSSSKKENDIRTRE